MAFQNYAAAARQHDNACDCCGPRHEAEPAHTVPSLTWRRDYRRVAGRIEGTHSYIRADTGRMESTLTRMVDPILLLASYRRHANRAGYGALHYGELRQAVVSPVHLPDMRPAPPASAPIYTGPAPANPTEPEPLVVPVSQTEEE